MICLRLAGVGRWGDDEVQPSSIVMVRGDERKRPENRYAASGRGSEIMRATHDAARGSVKLGVRAGDDRFGRPCHKGL